MRAARILWAKIVAAYGGGEDSQKMVVHGRTSRYEQTRYDAYTNMLRSTCAGFAAVLGGADTVDTAPFDDCQTGGDRFSRRIARNTQLILGEETLLDRVVDPAGGSYYVETLTRRLAGAAWDLFREVQKMGGMLEALRAGYPQGQVERVARQKTADGTRRKKIVVGTNMYADPGESTAAAEPFYGDEWRQARCVEVGRYRESRPPRQGVSTKDEDFPLAAVGAFSGGVTLGEAFGGSAMETGAILSITPLRQVRPASLFEALRDRVEAYRKENGARPRVFLAGLGPVAGHKARVDFSRGFFAVAGLEAVYRGGFEDTDGAAATAREVGAEVVTICGPDDLYRDWVPTLSGAIKKGCPGAVLVLAGNPAGQRESFCAAGIDEFIHLGADAPQILDDLLNNIGVK